MDKIYITPESLLEDSYKLALNVLADEFDPKFIVGVWRGGAPIAVAVHEAMDYYGVKTDHMAVKTSSYHGMKQQKQVKVSGLEYLVNNINADDHLLIVDDVFDTGLSVEALLREIKARCASNAPKKIKVATVYFKPTKNQTSIVPDFYIHKSDSWLVFPHELKGLSHNEIKKNKGVDLPLIVGKHTLKGGDDEG